VGHEPPLVARPRNVANAIENGSQIVLPMGAVLAAQQQIRQHNIRSGSWNRETSAGITSPKALFWYALVTGNNDFRPLSRDAQCLYKSKPWGRCGD